MTDGGRLDGKDLRAIGLCTLVQSVFFLSISVLDGGIEGVESLLVQVTIGDNVQGRCTLFGHEIFATKIFSWVTIQTYQYRSVTMS